MDLNKGLPASGKPLPAFDSREADSFRQQLSSYEDFIALIARAEEDWRDDWLTWADRTAVQRFPKDMELVARWMLHEAIRHNVDTVRTLRIVLLSLPENDRSKPTMLDALARGDFLLGHLEQGSARLDRLLMHPEYDALPARAAQLRAFAAAGPNEAAILLAKRCAAEPQRELRSAATEVLQAASCHAELCALVAETGGIGQFESGDDAYRYLSSLEATGRLADCLAEGIAFLEGVPASLPVAQLLRHIAMRLDAMEKIAPHLRRCADAMAGESAALELRGLIELDRDDYRKARAILRLFDDATDEPALRLALSIATTDPATSRRAVRRAYRAYRRLGVTHAGPEMQYASYLSNAARSRADLREALDIARNGSAHAGWNPYYHRLFLSLLVANGEKTEARAHLALLPEGLRRSRLIREVDMCFRQADGAHEDVRQDWVEHAASGTYRVLSAQTEPPQPAASDTARPAAPAADEATVFAVVFNGIDYVAPFLAHYRALGVGRFVVVDNGSTDGTREAFAAEADVVLYDQAGSFRGSAHGVAWINPLLQDHAAGRWALFVDIDEHLVFPGLGAGRKIGDLLRYADGIGAGCFASFMLDLFATPASAREGIAGHRYFDSSYVAFDGILPPYRVVQGGIRGRLTGRQFLITKSPLVRVAPDLMFLENNHVHTHLPPAPVTTALLHYKFLGDSRGRFEEAVERGEHFLGGRLYRDMLASMKGHGIRRGLWARRYRGDGQLLRMGLLRTTKEWHNFQ